MRSRYWYSWCLGLSGVEVVGLALSSLNRGIACGVQGESGGSNDGAIVFAFDVS